MFACPSSRSSRGSSRCCRRCRSRSSTSAASSTPPSRTGTACDVRWALMYPDAYEVGLPNQGVQILYEVLNERDGILAERTYAVWPDLEALMREHGGARSSPSTRTARSAPSTCSASRFSTELGYTNMLTALDLAGIPLHARRPRRRRPDRARRRPRRVQPRADRRLHRRRRARRRRGGRARDLRRRSASGRARAGPGGRDGAAAAAGASRRRLRARASTTSTYLPDGRIERGRARTGPACRGGSRKHTVMDLDAWPYPKQAAGAAGRDRARAVLASRSSAAAPAAAGSARPA